MFDLEKFIRVVNQGLNDKGSEGKINFSNSISVRKIIETFNLERLKSMNVMTNLPQIEGLEDKKLYGFRKNDDIMEISFFCQKSTIFDEPVDLIISKNFKNNTYDYTINSCTRKMDDPDYFLEDKLNISKDLIKKYISIFEDNERYIEMFIFFGRVHIFGSDYYPFSTIMNYEEDFNPFEFELCFNNQYEYILFNINFVGEEYKVDYKESKFDMSEKISENRKIEIIDSLLDNIFINLDYLKGILN